jgi:hypothetical protein
MESQLHAGFHRLSVGMIGAVGVASSDYLI